MGMFDTLIIKYPLPEPYQDMQQHTFQTKDLECELLVYTLNEAGELWVQLQEHEWVKDEKVIFGGYLRVIKTWDERVENLHCDIFFYDWREPGNAQSGLVHFKARFTEGVLSRVMYSHTEHFQTGGLST